MLIQQSIHIVPCMPTLISTRLWELMGIQVPRIQKNSKVKPVNCVWSKSLCKMQELIYTKVIQMFILNCRINNFLIAKPAYSSYLHSTPLKRVHFNSKQGQTKRSKSRVLPAEHQIVYRCILTMKTIFPWTQVLGKCKVTKQSNFWSQGLGSWHKW